MRRAEGSELKTPKAFASRLFNICDNLQPRRDRERGHWISVVCLALTCDELSSSMQASFSKVDVVLDASKDFVIDRFLVA